jgi:PKHD-type hydroxylase
VLSRISQVLDPAQVGELRAALEVAEWSDGRGSAGYLSQAVKRNEQLPDTHPTALRLGELVLRALEHNAFFVSAALPAKIVPPLFNRYAVGQTYGAHVDGAIRPVTGTPHRVRTDLSATIFLSRADEYDGGELVIDGDFGKHSVKLDAGDMVLYPGSSVHQVAPVTRGTRYAAFFWVQSMVRDNGARKILFDLDQSIQVLGGSGTDKSELVRLAGVYHNLLRRWADV